MIAVRSMLFLVLTTTLLLRASHAVAGMSSSECDFIPRQFASEIFSALPKNVIGSVTCSNAKEASSLTVLHINSLTQEKLSQAVIEIAKIVHPTTETSQLTWVSKQPLDKRQIIITTSVAKTDHSAAQSMLHYAFVIPRKDGSSLVFVHSAPEKETHALRLTLDSFNREFRSASFLAKIHG